MDKEEIKLIVRFLVGIVAIAVVNKYVFGALSILVVGYGVWAALAKRPAWALICYCLMPCLAIMNPYVLPASSLHIIATRLGMPAMAVAMMIVASSRRGIHSLPILGLFAYAIIAFISSVQGYCFPISALKLINFILFVIGMYCGTRNIHLRYRDMVLIRSFLIAFSMFIIFGSILTLANPSVAYFVSYRHVIREGGLDAVGDIIADKKAIGASAGYFCGITNHSQCLGPLAAFIFGFVLCDMLFVERRMTRIHLSILFVAPVVIFLTRARTALLTVIVICIGIAWFCFPAIRIPSNVKKRIKNIAFLGLFLMAMGAVALEISSGGVTRWVRKTEDTSDTRDLSDAITSSRMGKIEECLYDFRQNPLLGKGFQVTEGLGLAYDRGMVSMFSAPIEKGFMPTMILGETGIVGAIAFVFFLMLFYSGCKKRRYNILKTLFTAYLFANFGEATFFSPGGDGGPIWIMVCGGGLIVDLLVMSKNQTMSFSSLRWNGWRGKYR